MSAVRPEAASPSDPATSYDTEATGTPTVCVTVSFHRQTEKLATQTSRPVRRQRQQDSQSSLTNVVSKMATVLAVSSARSRSRRRVSAWNSAASSLPGRH